jgi:hypothetical protein
MSLVLKWSDCPRCGRIYRLNPTNICKCGAVLVTRPYNTSARKKNVDENVVLL